MQPLNSKWLSFLLIAAVGWLAFSLLTLNTRRAEFEKTLSGLSQKAEDAENNRTYLEKFMAYFKSPEFLEKEARAKLNYKLPDEEVVFVFRDTNPKSTVETGKNIDQAPNYLKWWYYILGY